MIRVFLDSSVLFSAAYSSRGHSRELLIMATREEITLVISHFVLAETKRNLSEISPEHTHFLDSIFETITFEFVRPSKQEIIVAAEHVVLKDAPIIAAARKAEIDFIVTLDKKHLLGKPEIADYLGAEILTPKEAVTKIKS